MLTLIGHLKYQDLVIYLHLDIILDDYAIRIFPAIVLSGDLLHDPPSFAHGV